MLHKEIISDGPHAIFERGFVVLSWLEASVLSPAVDHHLHGAPGYANLSGVRGLSTENRWCTKRASLSEIVDEHDVAIFLTHLCV